MCFSQDATLSQLRTEKHTRNLYGKASIYIKILCVCLMEAAKLPSWFKFAKKNKKIKKLNPSLADFSVYFVDKLKCLTDTQTHEQSFVAVVLIDWAGGSKAPLSAKTHADSQAC